MPWGGDGKYCALATCATPNSDERAVRVESTALNEAGLITSFEAHKGIFSTYFFQVEIGSGESYESDYQNSTKMFSVVELESETISWSEKMYFQERVTILWIGKENRDCAD